MKLIKTFLLTACVLTIWLTAPQSHAQGTTAFTYQGQLRDGGTNANGTYTMTFKLYDAASAGGQIGSTVTISPTLANGLFSVNLDFGAGAFNGSGRWLDITVAGDTLTPRVQVLPAPYAVYSATAGNVQATNLLGAFTGNIALKQGATGATRWDIGVGSFQAPNGGPLVNDALIFSVAGTPQMEIGPNGAGVGVLGELHATGSIGTAGNINTDGNIAGGNINANGNISAIGNVSCDTLTVRHPTDNGLIPQMQVFETSGTFVVPTNVTRIMVEVWGGGGAGGEDGGGLTDTFGGYHAGGGGGGGGGGGYGKDIISVTPGDNMAVTVGSGGYSIGGTNSGSRDGGTSSLGSVSATGGSHGYGGGNAYFIAIINLTYFYGGVPGWGGAQGSGSAPIRTDGGRGNYGFNPSGSSNNGWFGVGGNGAVGGDGGIYGQNGLFPGGGGSAGNLGAPGRVVIYY